MMVSRRTLLTVAGASAVGLGAAACGDSDNASSDGPVDIDAEATDLSGEISLLTPAFTGDGRPALDEIVKNFTDANPDVKVSIDQVDWDKLNEKLTTSIAGGIVADVIMSGVGWTPPFANKGIFAQLPTDWVDSLGFDETVLLATKFEDNYYSVPNSLDCRFIVTHPELLDKKGITENPTTLEDFGDMVDELTDDDVVGIDLFSANIRQAWILLLFAFGGTLFSEDGLTPTLHEEPGKKALQWMLDRLDSKAASLDLVAAEGQPTPFAQKKAATSLIGAASWLGWKDMTPELCEPDAVGMFVLPGGDGNDPVMFQGGTMISVGGRSKNQAAAAALVKHLSNGAQTSVPPTPDVPENEGITGNLLASFAVENLDKAGAAEGGTPAWMEIRGNLQPIIESCLTGKSSVDQALADMKSLCDDAISRL
jgi:multiple sugar transport system substrate-binding protein